ncbi:DUF2922 domain-containing protein [Bacillus sp. REN16]|nr:DUF2922 domain-containing protein [Bacillus sp. REN16]MCC3358194.1 DUF2922 domain-containing protein [Bacillus sp. REN16]
MDLIVSDDVFVTSGGSIVEKEGARLVERNVETVEEQQHYSSWV